MTLFKHKRVVSLCDYVYNICEIIMNVIKRKDACVYALSLIMYQIFAKLSRIC